MKTLRLFFGFLALSLMLVNGTLVVAAPGQPIRRPLK